jgi:hypothetical protein
MTWFDQVICRFRRLPQPLLLLAVFSRFVFGIGVGALLAASIKGNWKRIGWILMALGTAMVIPAGRELWREKE